MGYSRSLSIVLVTFALLIPNAVQGEQKSAYEAFDEMTRYTASWTKEAIDVIATTCANSGNIYTYNCMAKFGAVVMKYYALGDYESARQYLEEYRKYAVRLREGGSPCVDQPFQQDDNTSMIHFGYWAALYALDKAEKRDTKKSGIYAYSCQLLDPTPMSAPNMDDEKFTPQAFEVFMQAQFGNVGGQQAASFNSDILEKISDARYNLRNKFGFSKAERMKENAALYVLYGNAYKKCINDEYINELCAPLKEFREIYYRIAAGIATEGKTE